MLSDMAALGGGLVSRRALLAAGIHSTQIYRIAHRENWRSAQKGLYELEKAVNWVDLLKRTRVISPRSVISHEAAAHIHEIEGFDPKQPIITVLSSTTHDIEGVSVHRNSDRLAGHVVMIGGLFVTTLLRTIFDLSYQVGYERTVQLLDHYRSLGKLTLSDIERISGQLCRRGKPGSANFRRYLKEQSWRKQPTPFQKARAVVVEDIDLRGFFNWLQDMGSDFRDMSDDLYSSYLKWKIASRPG